jgi:uncharacterized heparinase superfamily protein
MIDVARLYRTVRQLRAAQILSRPLQLALRAAIRDVSGARPPRRREFREAPLPETDQLLAMEADRARTRVARLPGGTLLRAFESAYGAEIFHPESPAIGPWVGPAAVSPAPASHRARNLALAIHAGRGEFVGELARACRAVLTQLEFHLLGNHFLENGVGLCCGACATVGAESELWWRIGSAILDHELDEQFLADGGHFERSATYHLGLTTSLLELFALMRAAGRSIPVRWGDTVARAIDWIGVVEAPDGTVPLFNDAALDAAPQPAEIRPLAQALGFASHRRSGTVVLPSTGWVRLETRDAFVMFDAGPDGASYQPGHVHADALTLELWVRGRRTIVDFGVASYADDQLRQDTRATRSHNTIEVRGRDSSEVWAAFRTGRRATASIDLVEITPDGVRVVASHDGYKSLGVTHRRELVLKESSLSIQDQVGAPHVSRLRLATEAPQPTVQSLLPHDIQLHSWYPRHAVRAPARVVSQTGASRTGWVVGF